MGLHPGRRTFAQGLIFVPVVAGSTANKMFRKFFGQISTRRMTTSTVCVAKSLAMLFRISPASSMRKSRVTLATPGGLATGCSIRSMAPEAISRVGEIGFCMLRGLREVTWMRIMRMAYSTGSTCGPLIPRAYTMALHTPGFVAQKCGSMVPTHFKTLAMHLGVAITAGNGSSLSFEILPVTV